MRARLDPPNATGSPRNHPHPRHALSVVDVEELHQETGAVLRLRGADAVYAVLAQRLALPLVTWDEEILDRAARVVDVRTPTAL